MKRIVLLAAAVALSHCAGPTHEAYDGRAVQLQPVDLTSATDANQTFIGVVSGGVREVAEEDLKTIAAGLKLTVDGGTEAIAIETSILEGSRIEVKPKQPLEQQWHRLSMGTAPSSVTLQGKSSVRFHPGHKPTLAKVQLCVKVGEASDPEKGQYKLVDHWFDVRFSEPVSPASGSSADLVKLTPPAGGAGTCEWQSGTAARDTFTYFCRGFAESDTFHVVVAEGFQGSDGTPAATLSGQSSYEADLGPVSDVCTELLP